MTTTPTLPGGVVHEMPDDLCARLLADDAAAAGWSDLTPLGRNEFLCWVQDAKQQATRARRVDQVPDRLAQGQRRPCCWPGCRHRERTGL